MARARTPVLLAAMTTLALGLGVLTAGPPLPATAAAAAASPSCPLTDLGTPLASITVHEGAYGQAPDGRLLGYAAVAGENAPLNIVDARTGALEKTVPLPGASGGWGITVDDSGRVYIGSYSNGSLYSYDPASGQVAEHGRPVASEDLLYGLSHGPDGTIYGGTYPNAHAFAFHPDTGTFTDFGAFTVDGAKYVRATAFDPDTGTLYAGLGTTGARLFAIDVKSGAHREIPLPTQVTGASFTDLRYHDGKVIGYLDTKLIVIDAATGAHLRLTDGTTGQQVDTTKIISRGVSDPLNGVVYYSDFPPGQSVHRLMTLDLGTLRFAPAPRNDSAGALDGAALGFGFTTGPNGPVLHAFTGNYAARALEYDVTTGVLTKLTYQLQPTEPHLGHVVTDPGDSGYVYISAFLNGSTAQYDPRTGASVTLPRFGQVEGWTWRDGLLYAGVYPSGSVKVWDPAAPTTAPRTLFALEETHHQNRPMALVADDERLYVATTPGYGLFGGALTIYDLATEQFEVHRDIVPDQAVSALLKLDGPAETGADGAVLGGSSIDGGTGTGTPKATEAKLFIADPVTGAVRSEYVPVPGARSINALTRTRDGSIWGLADGTAFRFDPARGKVTATVQVYPRDLTAGATDGELVEHPNGQLYGSSRGQIFVVDPKARKAKILLEDVNRLALHPDGTFYTLMRRAGSDLPDTNRVGRFSPVKGCRL